jgi:hypothetical protein
VRDKVSHLLANLYLLKTPLYQLPVAESVPRRWINKRTSRTLQKTKCAILICNFSIFSKHHRIFLD